MLCATPERDPNLVDMGVGHAQAHQTTKVIEKTGAGIEQIVRSVHEVKELVEPWLPLGANAGRETTFVRVFAH